jgi:hypothetical protein
LLFQQLSDALVKTSMNAFLMSGKYEEVIELFESLPQRKITRTFDHAVMVIEALAKQGRLHDAWRSMSSLKVPIMNSMNDIDREYQPTVSQEKNLYRKTKYLLTQCEQCLQQIAFVAQAPLSSSSKTEIDVGNVKISKEDLMASILFSIDMILRAYVHESW